VDFTNNTAYFKFKWSDFIRHILSNKQLKSLINYIDFKIIKMSIVTWAAQGVRQSIDSSRARLPHQSKRMWKKGFRLMRHSRLLTEKSVVILPLSSRLSTPTAATSSALRPTLTTNCSASTEEPPRHRKRRSFEVEICERTRMS